MKVAYTDLSCCEDCVLFLANGDVSEERPDIEAEIKAQWPDPKYDLVLDSAGTYDEFSRSECDACGSNLGGARYPFSVLEP